MFFTLEPSIICENKCGFAELFLTCVKKYLSNVVFKKLRIFNYYMFKYYFDSGKFFAHMNFK